MQANLMGIDTLEDKVYAEDFAQHVSPREEHHKRHSRRRSKDFGAEGPRSGDPSSSRPTTAQKGNKDLSVTRTISFHPDQEDELRRKRTQHRRRKRRSAAEDDDDDDTSVISDIDDSDADDQSTAYTDDDGEDTGDDRSVDTGSDTDDRTIDEEVDDGAPIDERHGEEVLLNGGFYVPPFVRRMHEAHLRRKAARKRQSDAASVQSADGQQTPPETGGGEGIVHRVYRRTPVFSGTIAPFAIMLEIPGFTSKWYVHITPEGQPNVYRNNPIILDVGLAISLASAIIANLAILGRFSERMRPRKATITACLCFILHDVINIVALIVFGVVHAVDDGFSYSEAYWMTTASTCASLCCTATLMFDYFTTKDFRNAGSGLTQKQSQLVMVIMAFLAYISFSALLFALIMPLPFLDAMYFSVESLATIGLGDIVPYNTASKIVLFVFAPPGIVLLAVMVAIARQTILEEFEDAYKRRRRLYKQKMAERQEERKKHRQLRSRMRNTLRRRSGRGGQAVVAGAADPIEAAEQDLNEDDPMTANALTRQDTSASFANGPLSRSWTLMADEIRPAAKSTASGSWWSKFSFSQGFSRTAPPPPSAEEQLRQVRKKLESPASSMGKDSSPGVEASTANGGEKHDDDVQSLNLERSQTHGAQHATAQLHEFEESLVRQRREIEQKFEQYRKDLAKAQRNEFWLKLIISAILFACFWLVGGAIFSAIEGWSYFDGFYFVFVVFSTMGYGDFHPTTSSGRAFFIVWALFGVGTLTVLFSVVSDAWGNTIQQRKLAKGSKAKKPTSRVKKSFDRAMNRVLPPKIQERRRENAERKAARAEVAKVEAEKSDEALAATTTAKGENAASSVASAGGILKEPGDSGTMATSTDTADANATPADIGALHIELTDTAMSFHRNAVDFMELMRASIAQNIHDVAEIKAFMTKLSQSDHRSKIEEAERERILKIAKSTQEPSVVRSLEEWMLLHNFEATLHTLIHKSSVFLEEMQRKEDHLQQAKDEAQRLRDAAAASGAKADDGQDTV